MLKETLYKLKRPYHFVKTGLFQGVVAGFQYGHPAKKLKIIAITGTDGKTTSSTLLYHVLKTAGKKVALLSTVAAYINDKEIETGFHVTTPNPRELFQLFKQMLEEDIEYVVMETTSHGIYQYRTWGIQPIIAGLTNIAHEHIDYHVTYKNYLEAKAWLLQKAGVAVLNEDDPSFSHVKKLLKQTNTPIQTYSLQDRLPRTIDQALKKTLPEEYNQSNARLVFNIAQLMHIAHKDIAHAFATFKGIPGRMEVVATKPIKIIVDFAHTPQALSKAMDAIRNTMKPKQRLIAVYGAAGLRDYQKRPMMGQVGVEKADIVVLTAEDPRIENVWSIIRQMKEQLTAGHNKIVSIANRKTAIEFAIQKLAQPGDVVGIFGKGHEQSMCYGTTEYPWDDRIAAKEALK